MIILVTSIIMCKKLFYIALFFVFFLPVNAQESNSILFAQANELSDSMAVESLLADAGKQFRSNNELAFEYLEKAYEIASEIKYQLGLAKYWDTKGYFYRNQADYISSIECHKNAEKIVDKLNDSTLLAKIYNNLGVSYRRTDQYEKATQYHLKALSTANAIKNLRSQTIAINGLGNINLAQENYEEAITYFRLALSIENTNENILGIAINLNNIGEAYEFKEDFDSALVYYSASLEQNKRINNTKGLVISYNSIGNIYKHRNEYYNALSFYQKAYKIAENLNEKYYHAFLNINLGEVYLRLNNFENSLFYLNNGIRIAKEIDSKMNLKDAYFHLSDLYAKNNNPVKSLELYKIAISYKDSILNDLNSQNINRLKALFENEKQLKEIEALKSEQFIQEQEMNKQRFYLLIAVIGFMAAIVVVFVYFNLYRFKQKSNIELEQQKKEIELQRNHIEIKNQNLEQANTLIESYIHSLTNSIEYAKKIQNALLPPDSIIKSFFPESFILFLPKDIVSGDFYWFGELDNKTFFSAVDCTGHGVPGAFMSLISYELINKAVEKNNISEPEKVLDFLNEEIKIALRKTAFDNDLKDGMDIAFCAYDKKTRILEYSGALNPLYIIRENKLIQFKANNMSIGALNVPSHKKFVKHEIQLKEGDSIYIFTDGFVSQFGGKSHKKFNKQNFINSLVNIQDMNMSMQKIALLEIYENWRGNTDQTDDILVVGLKIT